MIVLSLNCKGLSNPTKKLAIKRLVDLHQPSILLLQESMMEGKKSISLLSPLFPRWGFTSVDASGYAWEVLSHARRINPKTYYFLGNEIYPWDNLLLLRPRHELQIENCYGSFLGDK
jgi:hypothetical protein